MSGILRIHTVTAEGFLPVADAVIDVTEKSGNLLYHIMADANGDTEELVLDAPDAALTLDPNYREPAYATYDIHATATGFNTATVYNVEIISSTSSFLVIRMHTKQAAAITNVSTLHQEEYPVALPPFGHSRITTASIDLLAADNNNEEQIIIPPVGLLLPNEQLQFTNHAYQSVRTVYIPENITVHLGRPQDSSARNVTIPFIEYVANVASSEIYPTWPYNSLVANIHCIISFALNRVYTEWYRSRSFPFDITNSTSYDQYFVYGRNIFDNIYEIVSDVFNVYTRRFGFRNPFFTAYCNGTTTTCRGLSQWGTVNLANQGKTPLQILHYYFPDDLELIGTDNIMGIEETYPGQPLRRGSTGPHVQKMQVYLNRIRANFPLIPTIPNPNGVFEETTDAAIRTFQRVFNLSSDGIIGKATWNLIAFTCFGVIKLAELDSEGERVSIGRIPPSVTLRQGSRSPDVLELQFILNNVSAFYESVPGVIQDNIFDAATKNAVIQFQKTFGLTEDAIVGPTTWNKLYAVYKGIKENAMVPPAPLPSTGNIPQYPGTLLRIGSRGPNVKLMQTYLNTVRTVYDSIQPLLIADSVYGTDTKNAVISFQQQFLLSPDGVIGPITWHKIVEMFNIVTGGV